MKGYSILIGVNKTNKRHYGLERTTPEAYTSVEKMAHYLIEHTQLNVYDEDLFIGKQAILKDIELRLKALADQSKKEPLFLFFYYAGHGVSCRDSRGKQSTFLCLYDQMIFQTELMNCFRSFSPKSKIFMVIDSCYAAGIANEKRLKKANAFGLQNQFSKSYQALIKHYQEKLATKELSNSLPSTLFIASVGKDQWARTNGKKGMFHFSYQLLNLLQKNKDNNYLRFFEELQGLFGSSKMPQLKDFNTDITYFKLNKPLIL